MKTSLSKKTTEQGSILLVTLTFGVILLVASASYLLLVGSQKSVVTRSQTWNAALPMAEAGVEEAMAQANSLAIFGDFSTFTNLISTNLPPQDFSINSWGTSSWGTTNVFGPVSRTLVGGSYSVIITTNDVTPTIYATGYTSVPITGGNISRIVKVTTMITRLNNVGIGAVSNINGNGNALLSDSWNSHLASLSNAGIYDSTKTSTNGDVASVGGIVNLGNRDINGDLYLGPAATYTGGNSGDISGSIYTDFNIQFPDVQLPAGAASWQTATTTNGNYDFKVSGNYRVSSDHPIIVEAGVTVALNVVSTSIDLSSLIINGGTANSGTAVFYINGPNGITVSGNNAVGPGSRPENLWIFGTPTLTSITWNGNTSFVGVIYAPEAMITLNGGPSKGMMGSVIGKAITSNGQFAVHFDESLANKGPVRGYVPNSWQEL